MKKTLTYIILFVLLAIQTSAGHYIKIFGVVPNITLTFTFVYALTNTPLRSAALGVVCGLLFDSCRVGAFGLGGFILMYTCLAAAYISSKFYYESRFSVASGVFVYTLIYNAVFLVLTSVLFGRAPFFYTFARYILVEALWNSLISFPMLILVKWLNNEYIRGI